MNERRIPFEKIRNARDLGGLRTAQGLTIAPGLLLRSADLAEATEPDRSILKTQYRLAKIIDLRTPEERQERPDAKIPGAEPIPVPIFDTAMAGISHEKKPRDTGKIPAVPKLEILYREMVTRPSCLENLGAAARRVMEHDFTRGSVLWHCTEGKDRCGLLTVVLLSALSVDRQTILKDYLLTNETNGPRADGFYQRLLASGRSREEAETVRDIFLAKESYLSSAFAAIDEQYPDMDAFLRDGLRIPAHTLESFRVSVLR